MAATITDNLKKNFMIQTIADINDVDNYYYAAVGKNDPWDSDQNPDVPTNSLRAARLARYGLQSYKLITDASAVVPRSNWSSGAVFSGWDDAGVGHPTNNFYVITDANQVYVCLQGGRNAQGQAVPSTVQPSGTSTSAFYTADGYMWRYLYTIGAISASRFLAANFMPVQRIDSANDADPESVKNQVLNQNAAVAGQIIGYRVVSGGTGYETVPAVTVVGDGTGATTRAFIEGGAVVKVEIDSDGSGNPDIGSGYNWASVSVAAPTGAGGVTAVVRPVIGPSKGFGYDPRDDLKSSAMMLNVKPAGAENEDWIITTGNSFRQVALIRNPLKWQDADSDYTATTGSSMRYLSLSSVSTSFEMGTTGSPAVLVGSTTGARAYLDDIYDSGALTYLYFHQNETTGFTAFQENEVVTVDGGVGEGVTEAVGTDADTDAYTKGSINPFTGELLYIDNRAPIQRAEEQTEDIKIVIQL